MLRDMGIAGVFLNNSAVVVLGDYVYLILGTSGSKLDKKEVTMFDEEKICGRLLIGMSGTRLQNAGRRHSQEGYLDFRSWPITAFAG